MLGRCAWQICSLKNSVRLLNYCCCCECLPHRLLRQMIRRKMILSWVSFEKMSCCFFSVPALPAVSSLYSFLLLGGAYVGCAPTVGSILFTRVWVRVIIIHFTLTVRDRKRFSELCGTSDILRETWRKWFTRNTTRRKNVRLRRKDEFDSPPADRFAVTARRAFFLCLPN